MNKIILFDVWEGSLEIDEDLLKFNNIAGLVIRINDMNGGHHLDENFFNQFAQSISAGLATGVYFVYNPWVNGQTNFNWLNANIPTIAKSVCVDIEVSYSAVSPIQYAAEVRKFIDLCKTKWNIAIYTGQWFLSYLAYWPTDVPYWWAAYPSILYPSGSQIWSYSQLGNALSTLDRPFNESKIPGELFMWQCSGDRIILPGTSRPVDINIFYGTPNDLNTWFAIENNMPTGDALITSEQWYDGCLYEQWDVNTEHGVVHTHLITLDTNDIEEIFVTPQPDTRHYVPAWHELFPSMDIAINCDQFVGIDMGGCNISHGQPYGPRDNEAVVFIDKMNNMTLRKPPISLAGDLWNAYAIPNILAEGGATTQHTRDINATKGHRPRTATGKSQDGSQKYILVVDGDETYDITTESGFDFVETSEFLLRHGAYEVYMSDGGGSSTLTKKRDDGTIYVVNAARGEDYQSKWDAYLRRVANCLMIKMRTSPIEVLTKGLLTVDGYSSVEVTLNP